VKRGEERTMESISAKLAAEQVRYKRFLEAEVRSIEAEIARGATRIDLEDLAGVLRDRIATLLVY